MSNRRGAAMLMAIVALAIMGVTLSATLTWFHATFKYTTLHEARLSCSHIAEAGLDKAVAEFQSGNRAYAGEKDTAIGEGTFSVIVEPSRRAGWLTVKSTGTLPRGGNEVRVRLQEEVQLDAAGKVVAIEWEEVRHD